MVIWITSDGIRSVSAAFVAVDAKILSGVAILFYLHLDCLNGDVKVFLFFFFFF